jgi:putative membrane protein
MPNPLSERRLHPLSFLFEIVSHGREMLLPGLFVLIAGARGSDSWQIWVMVLFVPYALAAVARSLVFRYRLEADELVIRSGLIFRQQRHVPYARIQNIDAIQTIFHRALGVLQVRLETAGGEEPEAKLNVVSQAAFEELRSFVMAARGQIVRDETEPMPDTPLLHLSPRELAVCGLIQGRGLLVIGALFGLVWETGLADRISSMVFGEEIQGRGVVRQMARAIFGGSIPPIGKLALTLAAFAALMIVTRVFSVGWALVRLYGFTLRRKGNDLRADFGLLTRVTATIPIRRIQSVTIHEGPVHRLFRRVSVHVDTAGGEQDESVKLQREWLAPVIRRGEVPRLLRDVLPSIAIANIDWQPVDPRGVRRARVSWIVLATLVSLTCVMLLEWWTPALFLGMLGLGEIDARRSIRALGWSLTDEGVFFRSGWVWRRETIAPLSKIQAVALNESPFDRRHRMAAVQVDTAGTSSDGHRIDVPYLPRQTAADLASQLAAHAGRTAFRW